MKRKVITAAAAAVFLLLAAAPWGPARAATMEELAEKLKAQDALIQQLVQKVNELESERKGSPEGNGGLGKLVQRVEALEKKEVPASVDPVERGWINAEMAGLLKDVRVNGYLDAAYGYNFNRPRSRKNSRRIFDVDDNNFSFNMAELVIQKPAAAPGDIGFRADLVYGYSQSQVTNSLGSFGEDEFDLQQAYIRYLAPIGNGLTLDFGKWVTHMGAEVIQGYDGWNDNYSRSFIFGLAIPFTHLGLRATYPVLDNLSLMAGIANGWDTVKENNRSKHYMAQAAWTPFEQVALVFNYGGGPEQEDREGNWRHMGDVVATVTPMDGLTFLLNYDFGTEKDVPGIDRRATWQGFSGGVRYEFNPWLALAVRGEFFNDRDGARTGIRRGHLREFTITPELRLRDNLVLRAEYRHDWATKAVFEDRGRFDRSQDTLAINFLYHF